MTLGAESLAVQKPFVRYAVEAGWTYLSPEEVLNLRRGMTSPVQRPSPPPRRHQPDVRGNTGPREEDNAGVAGT